MSRAINFIGKSVPGYGLPDGRCLPCSGVSGGAVSASSCSSRGDYGHCQTVKILTLKCASRSTSYVCSANASGHPRNPDFSRQNRQGFSKGRNRNRQYEERDSFGIPDDSEMLTSKNGPLLTGSGSPKFQATAAPGPREKEIVELFRKVQVQLRERAAMKEEKKVEEARGKGKESDTVDSLLKLLRKHSVQQGKKSKESSSSGKDFVLDQSDSTHASGIFTEDKSSNNFVSNSGVKQHQNNVAPVTARPRSVFQRRSPIRQVAIKPAYSDEETVNSVAHIDKDDEVSLMTEPAHTPELELESDDESDAGETFSDEDVYAEISEEETSETYEQKDDEAAVVEPNDYSEMKLPELRALAKSRGVKGFSKLKKSELIELLRGC